MNKQTEYWKELAEMAILAAMDIIPKRDDWNTDFELWYKNYIKSHPLPNNPVVEWPTDEMIMEAANKSMISDDGANGYFEGAKWMRDRRWTPEWMRDRLKSLNVPPVKVDWIPVSERLPEKSKFYICWCGDEYGLIHYNKDTGWQNGFYNDVVTHWTEPEPPKQS